MLFVQYHVASKCLIQRVMCVLFVTNKDSVKTEHTSKMKKNLPQKWLS
jgi:hypothetical protein